MLLDAHQHFWRYDPVEYPWIPPQSALARDWLPGDLEAVQQPLGLNGSIAVQARQSVAESDWLLGLADADESVKGVVGWVDLQADNLEEDLARLTRHPKFVGVRHVVQDETDDRFLLKPAFLRGVSRLNDFGLTYDILIYPQQLPAAIEFVQQLPEQPFVLDHIAKPFIRGEMISPWDEQIRQLAAFPNVMCKLSGMVTEADHANWKPEDFRPYFDVVVDAFTPQRLMWGSDWPVCRLAGSYEQVYRLVEGLTAGWSATDREALFGGNCARFYLT